jgi:hypothetical protein
MTIIEIRPYRNGWKVFEAPGVEPVFLEKGRLIFCSLGRMTLSKNLRLSVAVTPTYCGRDPSVE